MMMMMIMMIVNIITPILIPHTIIKASFRSPTTISACQLTITSLICPIGFIFLDKYILCKYDIGYD